MLPASLAYSYPKVILANLDKYSYLTKEDIEVLESYGSKSGGHGCFTETGWLYNARPDLTRLDLQNARCGVSTHRWDEFSKRGIYSGFGWMANYPESLSADYHEGMNERIAKAMTEGVVDHLADVVKFLKEELFKTFNVGTLCVLKVFLVLFTALRFLNSHARFDII